MQTRAQAALIINQVIQHQLSLSHVLQQKLSNEKNPKDKAFIQDLCFGVFRWQPQLDQYLNEMLKKPFKPKDSDIKALLWVGLYQIIHQRTPEHAAVSATVEACHDLKKSWAKNITNALLRRFLREQKNKSEEKNPAKLYAHPDWILQQVKHDWPDDWQNILSANQSHAPLTLRVNGKKISRPDYAKKLESHNIEYQLTAHTEQGVNLIKPCDVSELPGYNAGEFSVQDQAAQLAAIQLDLKVGQRVLDACAAPGGKASHCLELETELTELVALDNDLARLDRIKQNLQRLELNATILHGDASCPNDWWDDQQFDRILLDVPCAASGVIRRHPDIKYLRQADDLEVIIQLQKKILENIWPLLRPGGKLVYSTCSIFKRENEQQIEAFLAQHIDAHKQTIRADWGIERNVGRQILPGQDDMDGFFYACINKS